MPTVDSYGVRIASAGVPYADGAETQVLTDLLESADRSDGSDELAAKIRDWPTRYHYSPSRTNLVRPLRIQPGMRVLDVGCGTGPITRWLAEQGASVVGVEGSLLRAQAAAVRCAGLPNVEIVAGTIDDIPEEPDFDLIVVVGVLEYSPVFSDPAEGPRTFLDALRRRLGPHGTLALAIENQLGLKYLIGYAEDHHNLPWVGIEGYGSGVGPRTWNRRTLGAMLGRTGFTSQRWLFPFPDYKLPSVILDERLYRQDGAEKIIDNLLRKPVTADASAPSLLCDPRLAHRQFLEAGLGPDVANSFFVLASPQADAIADLVADESAWIFGPDRRRQWRRERTIVEHDGALLVRERRDPSRVRVLAWLKQAVEPEDGRTFTSGEPLDVLLLDAIRRRDMDALSKVLKDWRNHLERNRVPHPETYPGFPFDPLGSADLPLPGDFLDVGPANFIDSGGTLVFIDREWEAAAPVSAQLVQVRALWWFAEEIVGSGQPHPWGSLASVDEIAESLCALADIACPPAILKHWRRGEAELQHLVHRTDRATAELSLDSIAGRRTIDMSPRMLPFTGLRTAVEDERRACEEARQAVEHERQRAESLQPRIDELGRQLADELEKATELQRQVETFRHEEVVDRRRAQQHEEHAAAAMAKLTRLQAEHQRLLARLAAFEARLPVRIYRRLQRSRLRHR